MLTEPAPIAPAPRSAGGAARSPALAAARPARGVGAPTPTRAGRRRVGHFTEWLVLVVALGVVGAMIGWSLFKSHQALDATERDRLRHQARVVDDNVGQQLDGVNRALASVRGEYLATPRHSVSTLISMRLKALSDAIPGVRSMVVVDADGNVAASSVDTLIGRDFADRDYFRSARDGRDGDTLYVATPFNTLARQLHRRLRARRSARTTAAFAGVVAAALEPQYFEVLLRSVLYAPDMWASVAHGDGKVFVTMPQDAAAHRQRRRHRLRRDRQRRRVTARRRTLDRRSARSAARRRRG